MRAFFEKIWYTQHPLRWLLWPFSLVFQLLSKLRYYGLKFFFQRAPIVPIIVVGNLSVGGVGKTPLVLALIDALQKKGLRVGVVSRGYGGKIKQFPHAVQDVDTAHDVGDEPLLIVKKTGCPVVIAPKRNEAVGYLLEKFRCQVIISDDGLQHYAMGRTLEMVVIDGIRGLGNGMCLPAGPLRECPNRLKKADFLIVNGGEWLGAYSMSIEPTHLLSVAGHHVMPMDSLTMPVAAVAGIGHPLRFFMTLSKLGISYHPYPFPDHYQFTKTDFTNIRESVIIMTEKDAVKCDYFAADNWYYLPVSAVLPDSFWQALWSHEKLKGCF